VCVCVCVLLSVDCSEADAGRNAAANDPLPGLSGTTRKPLPTKHSNRLRQGFAVQTGRHSRLNVSQKT